MAFVDAKVVAAELKVHRDTVYRLIKVGLPTHRVGGRDRFDLDEIRAWSKARAEQRLERPLGVSSY